MKIRINGDSLRLRLSQTEVRELVHEGIVHSVCQFPQGSFQYQLAIHDADNITAEVQHSTVSVYVPRLWVAGWDEDERVGLDGRESNGLYILVEKDFQCLKPRPEEDETDLFPHPQADEGHHQC